MSNATCGACQFWAGRCIKIKILNKIALDCACEKYIPKDSASIFVVTDTCLVKLVEVT